MSNELIPQESFGSKELVNFDFNQLTSKAFLPSLRLCSSSSEACKDGKIAINHYGLFKDSNIEDLGDEINVVVCAGRMKAFRNDPANPISDYDVNSDLFQDIQLKSEAKDQGNMWGPEWLLWIPDFNTFAIFFMCSPTARREAPNFKPLIRKAASLKSRMVSNAKFKWLAPVVLPCSLSLTLPDLNELKQQIEKFLNPPKTEVKLAEEGERER